MKKLEDLPPLSEIKDFDKINVELDFDDSIADNAEANNSELKTSEEKSVVNELLMSSETHEDMLSSNNNDALDDPSVV